jgi:hypothetical protein
MALAALYIEPISAATVRTPEIRNSHRDTALGGLRLGSLHTENQITHISSSQAVIAMMMVSGLSDMAYTYFSTRRGVPSTWDFLNLRAVSNSAAFS